MISAKHIVSKGFPSFRFSVALIMISMAACTRKIDDRSTEVRVSNDVEQVLTWLPADTETLLVANGPFLMSDFQMGKEAYTDHEVTSEELGKHFKGLTLQLLNFRDGLLAKHLRGKKVQFALEASRHFRPPVELGELPFEGCALAVFEDALDDQRDAFIKEAAQVAVRVEKIEEQNIAVFEERSRQDIWQSFVAFPKEHVVLVATNEQLLREMLSRMRKPETKRALPNGLPEWKYVNTRAQFWGIRHFDKRQANEDPTSPFGGPKPANLPDDGAIGLTYECSPDKERKATLTYFSRAGREVGKIEEGRFPTSPQSKDTAGLHIQRQQLELGVIQSKYDLSRSRPLSWFFFVFMGNLGHAIYV